MRTRSYPWLEALLDGLGLALFMVAACGFGVLLEYPESPVRRMISDPAVRRAIMGLAMGLTAAGLIYSPWGIRSGAHLNPSVTLSFWRLGRVPGRVAAGYVAAQFIGGALGVAVMSLLLQRQLADPQVHYVTTLPGPSGLAAAFVGEAVISFLLMVVVLRASESPRWTRYTGFVAGALVALWIFLEAPLSGMSMNPARTVGSAVWGREWTAWWIYFVAPPAAMGAAAWLHAAAGRARHGCAKLHHSLRVRCVFCGQGGASGTFSTAPSLRDTAGSVNLVIDTHSQRGTP